MYKYPILLLIGLLSFAACDKTKTEDPGLALTFKANYDGMPLLIDEETDYDYFDIPVKITNVRFFISNVNLKNGAELTEIIDVADVDFTDNHRNSTEAAIGQRILVENLPVGEYDGLKFGIGLNPSQNAATPASFNSDHPLSVDNAQYWTGWSSYIFAKIEGRQDADNDGNYDGFSYHVGFDEMFRTKELDKTFSLNPGETTELTLNMDVKRLMSDGNTSLDVVGRAISHSNPDDAGAWEYAGFIMDNFKASITLE